MMDVRGTGFHVSNTSTLPPMAGGHQIVAERVDTPPPRQDLRGTVGLQLVALQASALPLAMLFAPVIPVTSTPEAIKAYGAAFTVIGTAASMARRVALLPEPGDLALLTPQTPLNTGPFSTTDDKLVSGTSED